MARETEKPTVTSESYNNGCKPHEVHKHPAYGTVTMTVQHGGSETLFGSDIGHSDQVSICIHRASLKRDLNRDWIHGESRSIVEFSMSHAQFAQFITSNGRGSGTPCTLRYAPATDVAIYTVPGIENVETKHDTFRREIAEAAKDHLDAIVKKVAELGEMIESGKLPKKELRELHKTLAREAGYLPGTMEFVVKSAEEALEKATSDAKIEVESYIQATAQRMGLNHINDLARIEQMSISTDKPHSCNYSRSMLQDYPRKCVICGVVELERIVDGS